MFLGKEKFLAIIHKLQRKQQVLDAFHRVIIENADVCDYDYGTIDVSLANHFEDIVVDLLNSTLQIPEGDDILAWWIYDREFGQKFEIGNLSYTEDGKTITPDLSTAEKMYDYLKKTYGEDRRMRIELSLELLVSSFWSTVRMEIRRGSQEPLLTSIAEKVAPYLTQWQKEQIWGEVLAGDPFAKKQPKITEWSEFWRIIEDQRTLDEPCNEIVIIELTEEELDFLYTSFIDYAFGRRTYIVLDAVDLTRALKDNLAKETKVATSTKISEALEDGGGGDTADIEGWRSVVRLLND